MVIRYTVRMLLFRLSVWQFVFAWICLCAFKFRRLCSRPRVILTIFRIFWQYFETGACAVEFFGVAGACVKFVACRFLLCVVICSFFLFSYLSPIFCIFSFLLFCIFSFLLFRFFFLSLLFCISDLRFFSLCSCTTWLWCWRRSWTSTKKKPKEYLRESIKLEPEKFDILISLRPHCKQKLSKMTVWYWRRSNGKNTKTDRHTR